MIWNLDGPPKLSHFLWRVCTGSMAVMERLQYRHISQTTQCPICEAEIESLSHTLFVCKYAQDIWSHSPYLKLLPEAPNLNIEERLNWLANKLDKNELRLIASLMWAAWSCRNIAFFENLNPNANQVATGFARLSADYKKYAKLVFGGNAGTVILSSARWRTPEVGWVKVNTDAHIRIGSYVGMV
ncbi:hypothetical protein POM88_005683 [Heracleum sosnowskyi]|uniref:Reverse transcriptase zinc-binding domain-containing protein n=1 Tax=Heracleum sosnowskyi TaxID=360622 RepID=A0AAD8MZC0_9APIA|nr:hypothetical protein POM88_005683 [Heracleum sosnowskyi]